MPKVSIITPCYDAEAFIGQLIESVRAQTLTDWEHVIVDDGSTDGSQAVIEEYLKLDSRLQLIEQPNGACETPVITASSCLSMAYRYVAYSDFHRA